MSIPSDDNGAGQTTTTAATDPISGTPAAHPVAPAAPESVNRNARLIALLALLVYVLFDLLLPLVPYHPRLVYSAPEYILRKLVFWLMPTAIFMLLQVWLAQSLVRLRWPPARAVLVLVLSVVVWLAAFILIHGSPHYSVVVTGVIFTARTMLLSVLLTTGLTALGTLLARIVREPNVLLPVALVAMPIDYVGAMTDVGFTNTVVKHAPNVVSNVSVHVPHVSGLPVLALIGPGDALFIAFFFAVVQNFRMNERGTFWWMFALLTIAIIEVLLIGFPIAALVPMGIAVIIANRRYFRLKREEVFAVLYAALILFALVGAFYVFSHRVMTQGH